MLASRLRGIIGAFTNHFVARSNLMNPHRTQSYQIEECRRLASYMIDGVRVYSDLEIAGRLGEDQAWVAGVLYPDRVPAAPPVAPVPTNGPIRPVWDRYDAGRPPVGTINPIGRRRTWFLTVHLSFEAMAVSGISRYGTDTTRLRGRPRQIALEHPPRWPSTAHRTIKGTAAAAIGRRGNVATRVGHGWR